MSTQRYTYVHKHTGYPNLLRYSTSTVQNPSFVTRQPKLTDRKTGHQPTAQNTPPFTSQESLLYGRPPGLLIAFHIMKVFLVVLCHTFCSWPDGQRVSARWWKKDRQQANMKPSRVCVLDRIQALCLCTAGFISIFCFYTINRPNVGSYSYVINTFSWYKANVYGLLSPINTNIWINNH